jgi:hypothetical protein
LSSLFYLEMVIKALHEKSTQQRSHIPYRNSLMTSMLRDSLGGNCKTVRPQGLRPQGAMLPEREGGGDVAVGKAHAAPMAFDEGYAGGKSRLRPLNECDLE